MLTLLAAAPGAIFFVVALVLGVRCHAVERRRIERTALPYARVA